MIRVLVVDDHPVVRQGLVSVLEDEGDFAVVGAVGSADEALVLAAECQPDVALVDLELPGLDGIALLARLAAASPATRALVFTAYETEERVQGAVRAGARGYLLKGAAAAEIASAVRAVSAGGFVLEPSTAARLVEPARAAAPGGGLLTGRERQVLRLVAEGRATKQIARDLGISDRTVKFHVASLFRKLGAQSRAQAVARASQHGLL